MALKRMLRRARPRTPRGMSLIEVMIALTLLAIAAVSITRYVTGVSAIRAGSSQRGASLIAIQEAVDSVRSLGYTNIATGTKQWSRTMGKVSLTLSSIVVQEANTMKTIDVTVTNNKGKVLQRYITAVYK